MLLQADGHAVTVFVFHFSSHSEAEVATIWCAVWPAGLYLSLDPTSTVGSPATEDSPSPKHPQIYWWYRGTSLPRLTLTRSLLPLSATWLYLHGHWGGSAIRDTPTDWWWSLWVLYIMGSTSDHSTYRPLPLWSLPMHNLSSLILSHIHQIGVGAHCAIFTRFMIWVSRLDQQPNPFGSASHKSARPLFCALSLYFSKESNSYYSLFSQYWLCVVLSLL